MQALVEEKLTKRGNKLIVKEANKNLIVCLEDLNMPIKDKYGTSTTHQLIMQQIDYDGWYDRNTKNWK